MAEGVGGAAPLGWDHHCDLGAHLAQQRHEILLRVMAGVQQHVKQRELNLAQRLQTALKIAGGQHLVKQFARQGCAGLYMGGHMAQHAPFPAEVLHELAG